MQLNPFKTWTWQYAGAWLPYMTLESFVRLRASRLRAHTDKLSQPGALRLRMKKPFAGDVWIRTRGSDSRTLDEIVRLGVYQPLVESAERSKYIVDLGANIGLASRFFADQYPESRLFCIEPDPRNFAILEKNLSSLMRAGRCELMRAAVWNKSGPLSLTDTPADDEFDSISVSEKKVDAGNSVEGFTMSELLDHSGFPRVDLLKIDVEGAEVQLFESTNDWLDRVCTLAIEFHEYSRARSGFDDVMRRFNFDIDDSHRHTVIAKKSAARIAPCRKQEALARA